MDNSANVVVDGGPSVSAGEAATPPDTVADDPRTLVATTSLETLQYLLYKDWIFKASYIVNTSMLEGAIIFALPIHPSECNIFVAHTAKMFNAWSGGMKIRVRPNSTAMYGGCFRICKLPPNLTRDQISTMKLEVLTAFPSIEMNPQNSTWRGFGAPDQRNILYHYAELDEENPATFGGWLVGFVEVPLIYSADGTKELRFPVELAGDFYFDQVNPFFTESSGSTASPYPEELLNDVLSKSGCDHSYSDANNALAILPVNYQAVNYGFLLAGSPGDKNFWSYGGSSIATNMLSLRSEVFAGTRYFNPFCHVNLTTSFTGSKLAIGGVLADKAELNYTIKSIAHNYGVNTIDQAGALQDMTTLATSDGFETAYILLTGTADAPTVDNNQWAYAPKNAPFTIYPSDTSGPQLTLTSLMATKESIVLFAHPLTGFMSTQPFSFARFLNDPSSKFSKLGENVSHVFKVIDRTTGVVVMYVRLCPDGLFTAAANTGTDILYYLSTHIVSFEYYSTISLQQPLPFTSELTGRRAAMRLFNRGLTAENRVEHFLKLRQAMDNLNFY